MNKLADMKKINGLTRQEARESLEEFKEVMNFNQYGSPVDRIDLFKI